MKRILILLPLIALAGCTAYDRTAAQPTGGALPIDQHGSGIGGLSGTQDRYSRAMRPTADELSTGTRCGY